MVKESWRRMQVPIFGILGILFIFLMVVIKLGVTTDNIVGEAYIDIEMNDVPFVGERCEARFYDPVCCSDGVTYDNLCLCRAAGVNPEYQGICR